MWELYAMWTWISVFGNAARLARFGVESHIGSLIAFAAISSGAVGCVVAGRWADTFGKARIARLALLASATCSAIAGFFFTAPMAILFLFAAIWGFAIVADSAQFSALVSEHSGRTDVGTALTLQTSVGFLLTMASIRLLPWFAGLVGWRWAFLMLVPGPVLGAMSSRMTSANDVQASNVPGVAHPVYIAGARITRVYPFGPLPGCAAMLTLISHDGTCCIGINTDPAAVTRPDLLVDGLRAGLAEVVALGSGAG